MRLLSHQQTDKLERSAVPSRWRSAYEILRNLMIWRPSVLVLPRSHVHWMRLDVRGVPSRFILSSLRLQLRQFLGEGKFGFAYRMRDSVATLWYWSEAEEGAFSRIVAGRTGEIAPWPEPLLRSALKDGVHLLVSEDGFEAVAVIAQELVRTRWYSTLPTEEAWASFVRDAGLNPDQSSLPVPRETKRLTRPPRDWKLSTSLNQPIPYPVWVGATMVAITGLLLMMGGAYSLKLDSAIARERVTYKKLAEENATTIALQEQINQRVAYLDGFRGVSQPVSQLNLMKAVLDSGLVSEEAKISLAEWEYRNNRLRLLFSVPQEEFSLSAFLAVLEKQPALRDIKLMPDSQPLTVGIQAAIADPNEQGVSDKKPTDATAPRSLPVAVTTSDRR